MRPHRRGVDTRIHALLGTRTAQMVLHTRFSWYLCHTRLVGRLTNRLTNRRINEFMNAGRISQLICTAALVASYGCHSSQQNGGSSGTGADATSGEQAAAPAQQAPAPPPPIVVRTGTDIRVTIDQDISSTDSNVGDPVSASLAAPIVVDGSVVVPQGARVSGKVTAAKSAGRFKGGAELGITLTSIEAGGKRYAIRTSTFNDAGKGRGKRTAEGAAIGAGAGALIGVLAGHGKGAAIGAGAGGGAGVAGAALTGDRDVTVAAETRLDFSLTRPLEIQQK